MSMLSVHSAALNFACYVGGFGSFGYLVDTKRVARHFGWPFPEVAFCQPEDEYHSLARVCALEEYRRVSRESKALFRVKLQEIDDQAMHDVENGELLEKQLVTSIRNFKQNFETKESNNGVHLSAVGSRELQNLEFIPLAFRLRPSSIDSFVNLGVRETYSGWITALEQNSDLSKPTKLFQSNLRVVVGS
jgi:hypothetical protein